MLKAKHVSQLIEGINGALPSANLTRSDVISGYSGLYPLQTEDIQSAVYQGTGEYRIIDHAQTNNVEGMVTALGAKFTTGRKISELTLPVIATKAGGGKDASLQKLNSGQYDSYSSFLSVRLARHSANYSAETITHLSRVYGSQMDAFLTSIVDTPDLQKPICAAQPDLFGQVVWAIDHEQALTVADIVFRRTSLGLLGINEAEVAAVADVMAQHLGWDTATRSRHLQECLAILSETQTAIAG